MVDPTGTVKEPASHRRVFPCHGAAEPVASVVVLRHQLSCVYVKLDDCDTESLPPRPCNEHRIVGENRTCSARSFYPGVLAIKPYTNKRPWILETTMPNEHRGRQTKVIRRRLPLVCVKSSTLHALQCTTADPGLWLIWGVSKTSQQIHAMVGHLRCLEPGAAFEEPALNRSQQKHTKDH